MIFFAPTANFEEFTNHIVGEQLSNHLQTGAIPRLMSDGQLGPGFLASLDHLIRFPQAATHRFLKVNVDSSARDLNDHVPMLIGPARTDTDDVRLHFV